MPATIPQALSQIDIAIFTIVILSGLLGLWRGLIKEVMSLATLVLAIVAILRYSQVLALQMSEMIASAPVRLALASALLFFGVMIIGSWLIALLQKILNFTGLQLLDRLAGGGFGLARGALIIMLCVYFTEPFLGTKQFWVESVGIARAKEAIEWGSGIIQPVMPVMPVDETQPVI